MKQVLFIFCCGVVSLFHGQQAFFKKLTVEPYLGVNISPKIENELAKDYFVNANGGLLLNYDILNDFQLHLGVGLSDRRFQYANRDTSFVLDEYRFLLELAGVDVDELEMTLSQNGLQFNRYSSTNGIAKSLQLEIPVGASYSYKSFQFNAGGYFSFLINGKKSELEESRIPLLETVTIDSIDQSGLVSSFLPPAQSSQINELSNIDNLNRFNFGFRFGVGYQYRSNVKFYVNYNIDLKPYGINENNLLMNKNSFFRVGLAYTIKSLKINQRSNLKARFE